MGGERLVILIHGIRTRALWMDEVKPALEDAGFTVAATSYGQLGLIRFLMPFERSKRSAVDRVVTDVLTARLISTRRTGHEPESMSVIAHSFGTYVLMKIISDRFELVWNRIILCGSVVREDFPLQQYLKRFDDPILNEIGSKDYWPAIAESVGWGYGSVGSTGFNRPPVVSRWHKDFTHSQFLTKEFCDRNWVPFLRDGTIARGDASSDLPLGIRLLTFLRLRVSLPAILLLFAIFFSIWAYLPHYPPRPPWALTFKDDKIVEAPEIVKFPSFSYTPTFSAGPDAPTFEVPTQWTRMTDAAGDELWYARNPDITENIRFDRFYRITRDGCLGTIVAMQNLDTNQILIPDEGDNCKTHELYSRTEDEKTWLDLGPVEFGK